VLKKIYNLTSIFHGVIIAGLLLGLSGCGYKASPFYSEKKVVKEKLEDKNVKFVVKKQSEEDNATKK